MIRCERSCSRTVVNLDCSYAWKGEAMPETDRANPIAIKGLSSESSRSIFATRRLESQCMPLKRYLKAGLDVLDVGCGPGTITVDVAEIASPGSVWGIDLSEESIQQASQLATGKSVTFKIGDGAILDFPDSTFDLVYSNSLLEWVRDPEGALREQRRVTRPGGRVVAITNSNLDRVLFPRSLAIEKLLSATMALADPKRKGMYLNGICSRQTVGMFKAVGFSSLHVEAYGAPVDCVHAGSEFFDYRYETLVKLFGNPDEGMPRYLIREGIWDKTSVQQARRDLDEWHEDPRAFYLHTRLLVAGQRD